MAWRRPGDNPLSASVMVNLPTHVCVTRPQCNIVITVAAYDLATPGPRHIITTVFPGMVIPDIKIRRSQDRLIFIMRIPIPIRRHFYIETVPRSLSINEYHFNPVYLNRDKEFLP